MPEQPFIQNQEGALPGSAIGKTGFAATCLSDPFGVSQVEEFLEFGMGAA